MTEQDEGRGVLWRLERDFLRPYRWEIGAALLGLLVQSVMLLPAPLLQGWVVDQLVAWSKAGPGAPSREAVGRAIVLALAATIGLHLARSVLSWWTASAMGRISQEVVREIRGALHQKLMRLPMAYFDSQQTGRLMARVTSDVGGVLMFVRSGVIQLLSDLILAVAITGVLFWLQWRLALAAMVAVPLYALNQAFFFKRLRLLSDQIRAQISALYALLSERVSAVRVVRSFAKEDAELAALDERIDAHRALSWANTRAAATLAAIATLISGLGTVFVVGYGIVLVGRGVISVGELLAFYALIGQLYAPIVRLTQFQATALSTQVSLERLYEIFDEPEPIRDRPDARPIVAPRGKLEFQNVRFTYGRRRKAEDETEADDEARSDAPPAMILDGLNLTIEPGSRVGVLGPSGAGKSTLLALAPRLYDVAEGSGAVRFDGVDVRDLKLADLRRAVALVPQQALLFEGTIRSNLLYAKPDATLDEIRQALEIADLAAMVDGLPKGLDTPVGERGYSLSGGQRQRLALARAILVDPAVLLMDDCTSALDAETEARIQNALDRRLPGRTCVVVSHKVSSVRRCDQIVVLDHGRIVERGSHDQLVALGRRYADAFQQQTRSLTHVVGE
ncbi:ABC transporter ATP-binding protein [Paludisphaera borealis]|uniref:Multidrug export ATP-binding/permease protein n=1 Tax=Paludisphaera borealis TaxID=1387353 RepID=A0A1U7CJZ1_9BACT|nr:ABC transporter ATP-binding protein [Paludisphaera borealis]APW59252.1 Putative multidrug export ATP-binding/permease protein [Paludisphaera borealis]